MIFSPNKKKIAVLLAGAGLLFLFTGSVPAGGSQARDETGIAGLSREEALRLGERMYRKGLLSSGEPMTAVVKGDIPVEGTMFSCESCHMRGGFGSYEGGVQTTPTTGKYLYRPVYKTRQLTQAEKETIPKYFRPLFDAPPTRPAYTDATLAAVLRGGVDPSGRVLNLVMPRYLLNDRDMAILIFYLKALAPNPPGVTDANVRFATVVTDDVSQEERDQYVKTLENYAQGRNIMAEKADVRSRRGFSAEWMDFAYRRTISITRWELKGRPETWRGQLEEYYRKDPVFAILGGVTNGEWRPIHEFSEERRIPCLLPLTDFPVISPTDWYTVYFSKGFYQEGEGAARYLVKSVNLPQGKKVVQVFSDTREGRAIAEGFRKTWLDLGHPTPVDWVLRDGEAISADLVRHLMEKEKPAVLLLWVGKEALPLLKVMATAASRPEMVYVSAGLLRKELWQVPENARAFTYITYPYSLQVAKTVFQEGKKGTAEKGKGMAGRRISSGTWSLWLILNDALMMLGTNFYRDNFLDRIDCIQDKPYPYTDYERLSFGPGQRYAAKGCYVVQLSPGPNPELVKKGDWVIH